MLSTHLVSFIVSSVMRQFTVASPFSSFHYMIGVRVANVFMYWNWPTIQHNDVSTKTLLYESQLAIEMV